MLKGPDLAAAQLAFIEERLRELGLSANAASLKASDGRSRDKIRTLTRGNPAKLETLRELAPVLQVPLATLLAIGADDTAPPPANRAEIPIRYLVSLAMTEQTPDKFEVTGKATPAPVFGGSPAQCFGARILDKSAAAFGYKPGAVVIVRALADAALSLGDRVLVRHRLPETDETIEVLIGTLGLSATGDLIATTGLSLPSAIEIQSVVAESEGFAERGRVYRPRSKKVDYRPRPEDPAEILGVIEKATTPRRSGRRDK